MSSYRRAIIVIGLPLPRDLAELVYLAQKPRFMYIDQIRDSRIRRSEPLRLLDHPSCCPCSRCFHMRTPGCRIILHYLRSALPDPDILDNPDRRDTLVRILGRLRYHGTAEALQSLIDSGRLPWGKPVFIFDNDRLHDVISPVELMEELRDSVPLSTSWMSNDF